MATKNSEIPIPQQIRLHRQSRVLELDYGDQAELDTYRLSFEYLRVFTPSAEARGHAPGQEILQVGKRDVDLLAVEPIGNYALKLLFSDGHDSGLYTWELLYNLAIHHDTLWPDYLRLLEAAGASRDGNALPPASKGHSCAHHH